MASKENMLDRAKTDYEKWRKESGDYQSRFCYELVELNDRIARLKNYIDNDFPGQTVKYRQERLRVQLKIMEAYKEILDARFKDDQL
jgi:hypothetical protein